MLSRWTAPGGEKLSDKKLPNNDPFEINLVTISSENLASFIPRHGIFCKLRYVCLLINFTGAKGLRPSRSQSSRQNYNLQYSGGWIFV